MKDETRQAIMQELTGKVRTAPGDQAELLTQTLEDLGLDTWDLYDACYTAEQAEGREVTADDVLGDMPEHATLADFMTSLDRVVGNR